MGIKKLLVLSLALVNIIGLAGCESKPDEIISDENEIPSTALYGVSAEVMEVFENGRCEVKVIGADQNFVQNDIVSVNYDKIAPENSALKMGDIIAITYSTYEKTETIYEITTNIIEFV